MALANGPGFSVGGDLHAARNGTWGWERCDQPPPREDVIAITHDEDLGTDVEFAWLDNDGIWRSPNHDRPLTVLAWMPKPRAPGSI